MPEMGIGTAAHVHLGTAMINIGPDTDACGSMYFEDDYLRTPVRIEAGRAYAPEGPGLGVELDIARLEQMTHRLMPER
jgi:muconate cycloisomerase